MAATKQIINLTFESLNSEAAQYKPFNCVLGGDGRIMVAFEIDSKFIQKMAPDGAVALTPEGMAFIAAEWYKVQFRAKLRADAELAKEAKGGK